MTRSSAALALACAGVLLALGLLPLLGDVAPGPVLLVLGVSAAVGVALPFVVRDQTRVPPLLFFGTLLGGAVVSLGFDRRDLVACVFGGLLGARLVGEVVRARREPDGQA